jgi:uncharacterized protein
MNRADALTLLHAHMSNVNLRRHSYAVAAVMKTLAAHLYDSGRLSAGEVAGRSKEEVCEAWDVVGLLHDGDYESTKNDPARHTVVMTEWLKDAGVVDRELHRAILSHNFAHTGSNKPENLLEWSLYSCDELTGFIIAVSLVRPEKTLASVTVDAVLKKWPQKAFAAGVHRSQIESCEKELGITLPEFIGLSLTSMQGIHAELGL